ncbi:MAG TPA: sensor histidine kinase [Pseudonocardiaceae bacterium]
MVSRLLSPRTWSLARQLFALQVVVIAVVVAGGVVAAYVQSRRATMDAATARVIAVAGSVAAAPTVLQALSELDPAAVLQPYAEKVRRDTATDFVVVMSPAGVRYTHPNPREIGGLFLGHTDRALRGETFTETYTGTLGPSVRAVAPVLDGGTVRALVAVGITLTAVDRGLRQQVPTLVLAGLAAIGLAGAGSWLVSRRLRRQTHNMGPAELSRMYEFYDAVLHAVHEGLLLLDRKGVVQLANDEARLLLALPDDAVGRPVDAVGLPPALGQALAAGQERSDEIHLTGDRTLVINQARAYRDGHDLGTVVTVRDHTDLRALSGELDSVRGLAESLRSQAHEAANRLHTLVSLIELGHTGQALEFATTELALAQRLTDRVVSADVEPVLAALLLGKAAEASERGIELLLADNISVPAGVIDGRDLITIMGNLIDNAIDAAAAAPPPRRIHVDARVQPTPVDGHSRQLVLRVADSGTGIDPADIQLAFRRGWSTKTDERLIGRGLGLALVGQTVHRHGGSIDVSRDRGAVFTVRLPLQPAAGAGVGLEGHGAGSP